MMNPAVPGSAADLKILIISDAAPSRNGVGAYYQDLLEPLGKRVRDVRLYSPTIDENGHWQAGFILPLPGDSTQKMCFPNFWKLKALFKEMQPDLVIIATPGVYGICGAYLSKRYKIPFLTGMHTSFEHLTELYWPNSIRGKIVEKYFLYSNGYLFKRTEAVLGNAQPILEQALRMGAPKIELIGTPVSSEFAQHKIVPYSGNLNSCLFAGRLAKEKNIEQILMAARNFPNIHFSIAGDGPMRNQVEEATASNANLEYLGWLSRQQLRDAVDQHDALILPSHFETFGTIALEAMARQRVVIVSKGCGISNWPLLQPGLLIINNEQNLADCLKDALTLTVPQRVTLVNNACQAARELNDQVVENWCSLIMNTITDFYNTQHTEKSTRD